MAEGRWRAPWMRRRGNHNNDQRHGQSGVLLRGSALHVGTAVDCPLLLALQAVDTEIFALHGEQMDVYLATLLIWPFTLGHVSSIDFASVPMSTWWETDFVVFFGTYISYICMMVGQQTLRPTVVSVYNYMQPLVSVSVSVAAGLAVFKTSQALAAILVFSGVWFVVKSKSKHDMSKA